MKHPLIIQGGMGVAVSGWRLARAVSLEGQLGVVSGTLLAVVLARRLQLGDPTGDMRRALSHFPVPGVAERILQEWFIPEGKASDRPFKTVEMPTLHPSDTYTELTVAANFVEVFLAKENHSGVVGINLLEKIQLPTLPSLYGAMLAGVDYVLMGAGIPRAIPGVLDQFAKGEPAELPIDIIGNEASSAKSVFDPVAFCQGQLPSLNRPQFLAIISSVVLATTLAKKSSGRVDGFVVEGQAAGGHNAPPRGAMQLNELGEPIYGPRDIPDLEKIRDLGLPFWLAGAHATSASLAEALALGAQGVQVGTAFAFCEESGITPEIKERACALSAKGQAHVFTDPQASPTGFPFKVLQLAETLSENTCYETRPRVCDLGYLREICTKSDGTIEYRCAAEPVGNYLRKGGCSGYTEGRKCLCNGLLATVGLAQIHARQSELPLITAGNDIACLVRYFAKGKNSYTAADVINTILSTSEDSTSLKAFAPETPDAELCPTKSFE